MRISKLACTLAIIMAPFASSGSDINIPDIGTAGVMGLSVQKEQQIGEYFIRTARSFMPVIDDPALDEYVASLGNKLLINANHVKFPFDFFVVKDTTLNASAFLGGKVRINSGLFYYCDTEDEFASVIAHEITHVTQRHIARFIEQQSAQSHLTTGALVGAIVMSLLNPAVGMAALTSTMGATIQSSINFTRDNEYEADRIGIELLYKSGFNPRGSTDLFKKLQEQQGNINPAFTMLIDHPLSQIRVSEASARIATLPARKDSDNPDFFLAKARSDVRYMNLQPDVILQGLEHSKMNGIYKSYVKALCYFELNELDKAQSALSELSALKSNIFVIDLQTDIDLKRGNINQAISRLQQARSRLGDNKTVMLNLANIYYQNGSYDKANALLESFIKKHPNDFTALSLLSESYFKSGKRCEGLRTRGTLLSNIGNYNLSIAQFNEALNVCTDSMTKEKIKAQVVDLVNQRSFDEELNKGM